MAKKSALDALTPLAKFARRWPLRTHGRTLVVGSKVYEGKEDRRERYPNAFGVDLFEGEGVDLVHDLEKPLDCGLFDHIDCVSVLEHCQRPWLMAANIEAAMSPEATILISVPFCWRIHDYPGDYYRFSAESLPILFPSIFWYSTKYLVHGKLRKFVPGERVNKGVWIARAELVAVGFKCK